SAPKENDFGTSPYDADTRRAMINGLTGAAQGWHCSPRELAGTRGNAEEEEYAGATSWSKATRAVSRQARNIDDANHGRDAGQARKCGGGHRALAEPRDRVSA